ncbi:microphthalmia-associated transcription factor-like isoform X1 [Stegodyphus dumicola]|uniref:microphthalmia-associated transcription factor-like isoform X1 n=1 Tax=Stegodyphus dumicola TaxID=202533 RepID=UPI0015B109C2|nr:microphthalmia-associated transcription factor-like isoform X1 [Stegodyphus dumicola]
MVVNFERQVILKQPIMISRTNLKQQLMREQMQQLEKKEREQLSSSVPTHTSSAIRVPLYGAPMPVQVPKQVLMVKSKLENPTPYHVRESQQRQVREYLSQSHHGYRTTSLPTSPPVVNSVDPSPTSDFSAALSSTAASPGELEEFWQDFQNFNSCTDSVADNLLDPSLTGPITTSVDEAILEVLSRTLEPVSTSCPAGLANETEIGEVLTEEKVQAFQKDRQKKDNHNRIERRRRFNINDRIKELGTLLPRSNDPYYDLVKDLRQNKGTILKASVDYVRCLKKEVQKIPDLELRCRMVDQFNKRLLLRIQELELQLKANNIPVSESTWIPSSEAELNAIIKQEVIPSPPLSNSSHNEKYFPNGQSRMTPVQEHYNEYQHLDLSSLQLPHSDPNVTRKRLPIMQFLVKKESQSQAVSSSSCSQSPATCCASPATSYSPFDDLMMEDEQPVTGDPMLSSRETFTPENMDFMS